MRPGLESDLRYLVKLMSGGLELPKRGYFLNKYILNRRTSNVPIEKELSGILSESFDSGNKSLHRRPTYNPQLLAGTFNRLNDFLRCSLAQSHF